MGRKKNKTIKPRGNKVFVALLICIIIIGVCYFAYDYFSGNLNFSSNQNTSSNASTSEVNSNSSSINVPVGKELKLYSQEPNENDKFEIYFFQLENANSQTQIGDAIYINYGNTDIIIDAGEKGIGSDVMIPYLNEHMKDDTIELCINTHTDSDHIGGFVGKSSGGILFSSKKINYVIDSGYEATTEVYKTYKTRLNELISTGTTYYSYEQTMKEENAPSRFYLGPDTYLDILDSKIYENNFAASNDVNDYSVPVKITHGENTFLLMGDCEKKAESNIIQYNNLGKVDFFKANHHGSETSNTTTLLDIIKPDYIVIDATRSNKYNLPRKTIIDRLLNYTEEIYTPFLNGGIHVYSDKTNITFECDGFIDYTVDKNGVLKEETKGKPIRIQESDFYEGLV